MGDRSLPLHSRICFGILLGVTSSVLAFPPSPPAAVESGAVVDWVEPKLSAAAGGLKPGDRLIEWSAGSEEWNPLTSPMDVWLLEIENGPRGPVRLKIQGTSASNRIVTLARTPWGLGVRPVLPDEVARALATPNARVPIGPPNSARVVALEKLAQSADTALAVWSTLELAGESSLRGQPAEAVAQYERSVTRARAGRDVPAQILALMAWGDEFGRHADWTQAINAYRAAVVLQGNPGETLLVAQCLEALANFGQRIGDPGGAAAYLKRALVIRKRLAPQSELISRTLDGAASLARDMGDTASARALWTEVLALQSKSSELSEYRYRTIFDLAELAVMQKDWAEAARLFKSALPAKPENEAIWRQVRALEGLGRVSEGAGDLTLAAFYYNQLRVLNEREARESGATAETLRSLGRIATAQSKRTAAEAYFNGALTMQEKLGLSRGQVETLLELGNLAVLNGDLQAADRHFSRALSLSETVNPADATVATALSSLGTIAAGQSQDGRAIDLLTRAVLVRIAANERTATLFSDLVALAAALERMGRREEALGRLDSAVSASPEGADPRVLAQVFSSLERLALELGLKEKAADYHRRGATLK